MNHRQLADALRLTPGSVTTLVDRLETHQIARRRTQPDNRRVMLVELIPAADEATRASTAALARSLAVITETDRPNTTALFNALADALRDNTPATDR